MLRRIPSMVSGLLAAGGHSASHDESLPPNQPASLALTEIDSQATADGTLKTWRATSRGMEGEPFAFRLEMLLKTPRSCCASWRESFTHNRAAEPGDAPEPRVSLDVR